MTPGKWRSNGSYSYCSFTKHLKKKKKKGHPRYAILILGALFQMKMVEWQNAPQELRHPLCTTEPLHSVMLTAGIFRAGTQDKLLSML